MKYEIIYSFEVIGAIEKGQTVFVLDRKYKEVANVSSLLVNELIEILNQKEKEHSRFEFWTECPETEEEQR